MKIDCSKYEVTLLLFLSPRQEPYDPEEFVERLAWRAATGPNAAGSASSNPFESGNAATANPFFDEDGQDDGDNFDAQQLNDAFIQSIKDLTVMLEKQHKKCQSLEQVSKKDWPNWPNFWGAIRNEDYGVETIGK